MNKEERAGAICSVLNLCSKEFLIMNLVVSLMGSLDEYSLMMSVNNCFFQYSIYLQAWVQ